MGYTEPLGMVNEKTSKETHFIIYAYHSHQTSEVRRWLQANSRRGIEKQQQHTKDLQFNPIQLGILQKTLIQTAARKGEHGIPHI